MTSILRRTLLGALAVGVMARWLLKAKAQFLIGTPIQPATPQDYVLVTDGSSQAMVQVLKPATSVITTILAGGGPPVSTPGPSYSLWKDGAPLDWTLDQTGSTPLPPATITAIQTDEILLFTQTQWHFTFQCAPSDAAGEVVTVIQVDEAGASTVPMTLAQAKALAPQLFVGYSAGALPFQAGYTQNLTHGIPASSWNMALPIGITIGATTFTSVTYTTISWPASTGSNYVVNWSSSSPGVYIPLATDPLVAVPIPAAWGYSAQTINVHLGAGITGATGGFGEIVIVDGTTVHNFSGFNRTGTNTATSTGYGAADVLASSGWGSASPFLGAGVTAAGSSMLAGLIRQAETDLGDIKHALAFFADVAQVKTGFTGEAIAGNGTAVTGILQTGWRLAVPRDTAVPGGISALGQKVFKALQVYGCFVVDTYAGVYGFKVNPNDYSSGTISSLNTDMASIIPLLQHVTYTG